MSASGSQDQQDQPDQPDLSGLSYRRGADDQIVRSCEVCGAMPAAPFTFSCNTGMVIINIRQSVKGTFCRSCAQHHGRQLQAKTLWTGWWGILSFFLNLYSVTMNAKRLKVASEMSAPQGGDPARRLPPGPPLAMRPEVLISVAVVVVLLIALRT